MSVSNPSLGWERLQDEFYRSRECFDLSWDVNLSDGKVAIAPYCAAIAYFSNKSSATFSINKSVDVYSGSGEKIYSIPWLSSNGTITSIGWTNKLGLIIILRNGKWRLYYNLEGDFNEYDLELSSSDDESALDCKFWDKGFVVRTNRSKFYTVLDYEKLTPLRFDDSSNEDALQGKTIHCWSILPPNYSRDLEIYLSTDESVLKMTLNSIEDTNYKDNVPLKFISFPPNGNFVSVYSKFNRTISILSSNFGTTFKTYVSDNESDAYQMEWCSNDAVIVTYPDETKVIGPSDDSLSLYMEPECYLHPEFDGTFFLSNTKLEFLSRVGNSTSATFKIGSTFSSAILLDAIDQIDNHSPKATENVEIIKDNLSEAINYCILAAAEEFDPYWQKRLLRAATFGKSIIDFYNPDDFVETCKNLKVLNMIRQPEVGLFLTYSQYLDYTIENVIKYILLRKMHYLALKISQYLNLPDDDIYIDWACCKIKASGNVDDKKLCDDIRKMMKHKKVLSYHKIADVAYYEGRIKLSIMLLNYETDTSKQIPILLEMGEDEYALVKAEESGDSDSILYVLITLINKLSIAEFFKLLKSNRPRTIALFLSKIALNDPKLTYDYYYQDDQVSQLALIELQKSFTDFSTTGNSDTMTREILEKRKLHLNKAAGLLERWKFTEFEGKIIKEQIKVFEEQYKLSKTHEGFGMDNILSPAEIIEILLKQGELKLATKLHTTLKVDEKLFYWKVAKEFSKNKQLHDILYEFARSKKSPIGYEPFFIETLKNGDRRQASLYVGLCTNLSHRQRIHMYLKCDDFRSAVDEAYKKKDVEYLDILGSVTDNTVIIRLTNEYKDKLKSSRLPF
ncbi:hypothetical protein B5S32_g1586 [[Candida] boidinii]|nr:hypothetical protein B5S32_g1586 [[Candida] boidinii]